MIVNVHSRDFQTSLAKVSQLIDGLGSPTDRLWPRDRWPAMRFDRPLQVGAAGGHGPICYFIESYEIGRSISFRFTTPRGFQGTHRFNAEEVSSDTVRLRHVLEMRVVGLARFSWPFVFRPLHDALIEDALDRAEAYLASSPRKNNRWSVWVRLLRWALSPNRKQSRRLTTP
jgi:hypothetical protein